MQLLCSFFNVIVPLSVNDLGDDTFKILSDLPPNSPSAMK